MDKRTPRKRSPGWVLMLRYGVPLLLAIGGIVMILMGHGHVSNVSDSPSGQSVFTSIPTDRDSMYSAIGVSALIVALMVVMIGWFLRLNTGDGEDRRREEAARDYFTRTGRWPGERGPRGTNT